MFRAWFAAGLLLALLALAPATVGARGTGDAPSRAEYVTEAEKICEIPYRRALRLLYRSRLLADDGAYVRAGNKMIRAGRYALDVNRRLAALEPPTADATLIQRWLVLNESAFEKVVKAGRVMKRHHPKRADAILDRSTRESKRANRKVDGLGFYHCV